MRILLIQDSKDSIKKISAILNSKEIILDVCSSTQEIFYNCKLYEYNLIILEQMINSNRNDILLDNLRSKKISTPVLVISKSDDIYNKVSALRKGADDYLIEPFDDKEFLARIKAIIRRSNGYSHDKIRCGELEIDLSDKKVYFNEKVISLTKTEYLILEFLFLKKGSTLNKERFLSYLYSSNDEPEAKIIDVFICNLRKKLEQVSGGEDFIKTDWGRGYYLADS